MACQSWTSVASVAGAGTAPPEAQGSGGGKRSDPPVASSQKVAWKRTWIGLTPSMSSRPTKAGYMWREKCWKPVSTGTRSPPRATIVVWACPPA
jgi:hypothetical protein